MKKSLLFLGLLVGMTGLASAGGRQNQGWNVTIVTGTAATIFEGRGYLKKIILSSGATTSSGDYLIAYSSAPNAANGGGAALFPHTLYSSTQGVTPALVYYTTTTVANTGTSLNNAWTGGGECETCYIEINGDAQTGPDSFGLHIRQSAQATGGANQAAVYWSK